MAMLTTCWLHDALLVIGSVIVYLYLHFHFYGKNHWKKQSIPHLKPRFILGNTWRTGFFEAFGVTFRNIYERNKEKPLLGLWSYMRPVLFVNDLTLIKNVLVKDFQYFHDRGIKVNEELEPLQGHLVNMNGSKWRNLRVKLTPTFTSGKIKMMFPTMVECGEELEAYLEESASKQEVIEIKDILARFTTDIISLCAFGIQTNSLKNPDAEFRRYGKTVFAPGMSMTLLRLIQNMNIPFLRKLVRRLPKETSEFFMKAVRETIEVREKSESRRKDFMDLLIDIKNKGTVDSADSQQDASTGRFTFEQLAAQAFVFFAAGFETSSTTMQFALYELAKDPQLQRKVQVEMDTVLRRHNNQITYEAVQEMEYLDRVINETLRKYPPVPILPRECTKDYHIPHLGITIKKGTGIVIPIIGIQHDPHYFPDPDRFDPDRFSPEEKAKRDHFLHLPFGEGPRICIGNRFGLLQSKAGLIYTLSRYDVAVCEKTLIPMVFEPSSFILSPKGGMFLRIVKRKL